MGLGIAEVEAADLLEHDGVSVADTGLLEVEDIAGPADMGLLGEVGGVERESAVAHTVDVKELVVDSEHLAEVCVPALELEVPDLDTLLEAELLALDLGEGREHIAAAEEYLALVANTGADEEVLGDIDKVILGDDRALSLGIPLAYLDILAGHPPDTSCEPGVHAVFGHVVDESLDSEEVGVLHGETHIVDTVLLEVAESPVNLLGGDFVEGGLLDLYHEVLAVLYLGHGDSVEPSGLHVEFAARLAHADEGCTGGDCGEENGLSGGVVPFAVDGVNRGHVGLGVLAADTEHEVGCVVGVGVISDTLFVADALDAYDTDSVVEGEEVGVVYREGDTGSGGLLLDGLGGGTGDGSGTDTVVLDVEAVAILGLGVAAYLVEGRGHGADFDNAAVYVRHVEAGFGGFAAGGLGGDAGGEGDFFHRG